MPVEIRMPSLGQTTAELRIVSWLKAEGDPVQRGEPLLAVETDKSTLEVEAFTSGTLLKIVRGADEVVEAGSLLAYIGAPGEAIPDAASGFSHRRDAEEGHTENAEEGSPEIFLGALCGPPPRLCGETFVVSPSDSAPPPRVLASPVARQLARERGIDLAQVRGSGPEGRIEKEDVLAFCARRGER
jgi:pyruvate dehydrogenase E2 component (dihydrolipoamide acetyltransferase)